MASFNFAGVGFTFSGSDKGLEKRQLKVRQGFDDVTASMDRMNKGAQRLEKGLDSLSKSLSDKGIKTGHKELGKLRDVLKDMGSSKMSKGIKRTTKAIRDGLGGALDNARDVTQKLNKSLVVKFARKGLGFLHKQLGTTAKFLRKNVPKAARKASDVAGKAFDQIKERAQGGGAAIQGMGESVNVLKKILTQAKLQTLTQSLSLSKLQGFASGLPGLIKQGQNLTSSLEGQMVGFSKQARALGANMGYTGKSLKQFKGQASSMAYSLNMDVNTAALAIRGFEEAGNELRAMGFDSAKDFARFTEAFGVNADLMRNQGMRMTRELGLSGEGVKGITSSLVAMGQQVGDVTGAMNQMQAVTDLLAKRKALGAKPEDLERMGRGVSAMTRGFFEAGQDSDVAMQNAVDLFTQLTDGREQFQNMLAGTGEFPNLVEELGIAGGDVNKAMKALEQGPDEFAVMMAESFDFDKMTKEQANFVRSRLGEAFGDTGEKLFMFMEHADDATISAMKEVAGAEKDLGKLGKEAYSTGITLAESMERAEEAFKTRFRRISRRHARDFVRDTSKEFKKFNKTLENIVAEGGPMGAFVAKMSEAHQLGMGAFIPKTLRPMATVMGSMAEQAAPVATGLGALGLRFKHLVNPITLVTGGMLALGAAFYKSEKDFKSQIDTLATSRKAYRKEGRALKSLERQMARMRNRGQENTEQYAKLEKQLKRRKQSRKFAGELREQNKAVSKQSKVLKRLQRRRDRLIKRGRDTAAIEDKIREAQAKRLAAEKKIAATRSQIDKTARADSQKRIQEMTRATIDKVKGFAMALPSVLKEVVRFFKEDMGPIAEMLYDEFEPMVSTVFTKLQNAPIGEYATKAGDFFTEALKGGVDKVKDVDWKASFSEAFKGAGSFLEGLVFGGGDKDSAAASVGSGIRDVLWAGLEVAGTVIAAGAEAWWGRFTEKLNFDLKLADFFSLEGWKGKLIPAIKDMSKVLGATLIGGMLLIGPFRRKIASAFGSVFGSVFKDLGGRFNKELWPSDKREIKKDITKNVEKPMLSAMDDVVDRWAKGMKKAVKQFGTRLRRACESCEVDCGGGSGYGPGGGGRRRRGKRRRGRRRRGGRRRSRRSSRPTRRRSRQSARANKKADRRRRRAQKKEAKRQRKRDKKLARADRDTRRTTVSGSSRVGGPKPGAPGASRVPGDGADGGRRGRGGKIAAGAGGIATALALAGGDPEAMRKAEQAEMTADAASSVSNAKQARAAKAGKIPKAPTPETPGKALKGGVGKALGKGMFALEAAMVISGGMMAAADRVAQMEKDLGRDLTIGETSKIATEEVVTQGASDLVNTPAMMASLVPDMLGGGYLEKALTVDRKTVEEYGEPVIKTMGNMAEMAGDKVESLKTVGQDVTGGATMLAKDVAGEDAADMVSIMGTSVFGGESTYEKKKRKEREAEERKRQKARERSERFTGNFATTGQGLDYASKVNRAQMGSEAADYLREGDREGFKLMLDEMKTMGLVSSKDVKVLTESMSEWEPDKIQEMLAEPLMRESTKFRKQMLGKGAGQAIAGKRFQQGGVDKRMHVMDIEAMAIQELAKERPELAGLQGQYMNLESLSKIASGERQSEALSSFEAAQLIPDVKSRAQDFLMPTAGGPKLRDATSMHEIEVGILEAKRKRAKLAAEEARKTKETLRGMQQIGVEVGSLATNAVENLVPALGFMTDKTDKAADNMSQVNTEASGLFDVFNEDSKAKFTGFFTDLWSGIGGFFGNVEGKVDELFGNSISTDVEADFTKSSTVVTEFLTLLETGLKETVQKALVEGFKSSFGQVDEETKSFAERQVETYTQLEASVTEIFGRMWLNVLEFSIIASDAIVTEVSSAASQLSDISSAVRKAEALTEQVAATGLATATPVVPDSAIGEGGMEDLIQATHYPLWYTKHHGPATAKLNSQIAELINAVKKGQGAATGRKSALPNPGGGPSPNARRARADLLERTGLDGYSNDF